MLLLEAQGEVPWFSVLPFAAMLACIAILPLIPKTAHYWERHSVQLGVSLVLGIPVALWMWMLLGHTSVTHAVFEYFQFIMLLLALFTVSGGIYIGGDIKATPRNNAIIMAIGAVIASFIGTTGAAMLLIRPLLRTNRQRKHRAHTVLFFIFVVANCGGLLTPLGDPPLFMGYLRGVPFEWTLRLIPEWLFVNALSIISFIGIDHLRYSQEKDEALRRDETQVDPIKVHGKLNFVFLLVIIGAVALNIPSLDLAAIDAGQATAMSWVPWRELLFLGAMLGSWFLGDRWARMTGNQFTWGPIIEVAAIFIGIFLTMIPALKFLGQVAPKLPLNDITFFLFTGGLSSVLDNAPTYATFFEMARVLGESHPGPLVAGVPETFLVAISLGSVFCGALTYIGNGPNFMVKAVAENFGVPMPSFGGYVVKSMTHLAPTLIAMMCFFVADGWAYKAIGAAITAIILARAIMLWMKHAGPNARRYAEIHATTPHLPPGAAD